MLSQLRKYNFFVFTLLGPAAAQAGVLYGGINADPSISPSTPFNGGTSTLTASSTSDSGCGTAANATGCGAYSVSYGSMGLSGFASNDFQVFVEADFQDLIVIHAGLPTGTSAMLTFSAGIEGSLSALGLGSNSGFELRAGVSPFGGIFQIDESGTQFGNPTKGYQGAPLGSYSVTVPILIGEGEHLEVRGDGNANSFLAGLSDPGEASNFSLGDTVFWGGIQQVTVNGVPVSFTVTSGTGANYLQSFQGLDSVPEPASFWLVAAAASGVWFIRRRRSGSDRQGS